MTAPGGEPRKCGACESVQSSQWWQAEPRLCGHAVLCHECHTKVRNALTMLVGAARRLPLPVLLQLADTTAGAADMHERRQLAQQQVANAGGVPAEVAARHGRQCGWQLANCRDRAEHERWFP